MAEKEIYTNAKGVFLLCVAASREEGNTKGLHTINRAISLARQRGYKNADKLRTVLNQDDPGQEKVFEVVDELFTYIGDIEFVRDCLGANIPMMPEGA